jgi:hypothetical protein
MYVIAGRRSRNAAASRLGIVILNPLDKVRRFQVNDQ